MSIQPSGLATPEACKYISPGYAFFAYPGEKCCGDDRTPEVVRGLSSSLGMMDSASPYSASNGSQMRPSCSRPNLNAKRRSRRNT